MRILLVLHSVAQMKAMLAFMPQALVPISPKELDKCLLEFRERDDTVMMLSDYQATEGFTVPKDTLILTVPDLAPEAIAQIIARRDRI